MQEQQLPECPAVPLERAGRAQVITFTVIIMLNVMIIIMIITIAIMVNAMIITRKNIVIKIIITNIL